MKEGNPLSLKYETMYDQKKKYLEPQYKNARNKRTAGRILMLLNLK